MNSFQNKRVNAFLGAKNKYKMFDEVKARSASEFCELISEDFGEWEIKEWKPDGEHTTWIKLSDFPLYGGHSEAVCPYCGEETKVDELGYDYQYCKDGNFEFECPRCDKKFEINIEHDHVTGRSIHSRPFEVAYEINKQNVRQKRNKRSI